MRAGADADSVPVQSHANTPWVEITLYDNIKLMSQKSHPPPPNQLILLPIYNFCNLNFAIVIADNCLVYVYQVIIVVIYAFEVDT